MTEPTHFKPSCQQRRCQRSDYPYEAAALFLSSFKRRAHLAGLALGDDDGLVLAGAGKPADLERLALWGALSAADEGHWRQEIDAFAPDQPFFSLEVSIGANRLRVSGIGALDFSRIEIEAGLVRILGTRLSAAAP